MLEIELQFVYWRGDKFDETHYSTGLNSQDVKQVSQWWDLFNQQPRFEEFLGKGGISWIDVPVPGGRRLHLRPHIGQDSGMRGKIMALGVFYRKSDTTGMASLGDLATRIDAFLSTDAAWDTVREVDTLILPNMEPLPIISKPESGSEEACNFKYGEYQDLYRWTARHFRFNTHLGAASEINKDIEDFSRAPSKSEEAISEDWFYRTGIACNPPRSHQKITIHLVSKDFYLPNIRPEKKTPFSSATNTLTQPETSSVETTLKKFLAGKSRESSPGRTRRQFILTGFFCSGVGFIVGSGLMSWRDSERRDRHATEIEKRNIDLDQLRKANEQLLDENRRLLEEKKELESQLSQYRVNQGNFR